MNIGSRYFDNNKTHIMGILNVTPDSFSDGGKWNDIDKALKHAEQMAAEGASILDIGGESTRPGFEMISEAEEIKRVVPIIKAIKTNFDIPVSIDTYKSKVAEASLDAGADLINDIWGFKYDRKMAGIAARYDASCCLMHNRKNTEYNHFPDDLAKELLECAEIAIKAGVKKEKIILDPGIGFGKTYEQNLLAIKNLNTLTALEYPILLGCSRKSVIGNTLNLPVEERLEGTLATTVYAVMCGCMFIRVHDVKENYRVVKMAEAIKNI